MDGSVEYQIAFASLRGINHTLASEILARTGSEEQFFKCRRHALAAMMGFDSKLFDDSYRSKLLDRAQRETDFLASTSVTPVYYTSPRYPQRLNDCPDAPLMLYALGDTDFNEGVTLSIVGTRHATPYGIDFTRRLISDLSRKLSAPLTIISGLAFGIDICAHRAAMEAGLPTVAVLATGLNTIYPGEHRQDAASMVHQGGALITEYGCSDPVHKGNFVARNRVVAGMSDALVVAESAEKGGALITAKLAFDYQRDVFALPGRTSDKYSRGCNHFIATQAAQLITDADDLIAAMGWPVKDDESSQPSLFPTLSPEQQAVVDYLSTAGEAVINRMSVDLNIPIGRLTALLIDMEFRHLVLKFPGGKYRPA